MANEAIADVGLYPAGNPFFAWTQGGRNFAIHLHPEVIGRLGTESLIAFKRIPHRGLEIGGILLGRIDSQDETTTFWIEEFNSIESEHRSGPSYLLSDSDFAHFQTELVGKGIASIGIYRSQTRSEQLAIEEPDANLFERCFGTSERLFLMLAPMLRKGAFFFQADGELKCIHEFTLVSSLSSMAMHDRRAKLDLPPLPPRKQVRSSQVVTRSQEKDGAPDVSGRHSDQQPQVAVFLSNSEAGNMRPESAAATPTRDFSAYQRLAASIRGWSILLRDKWVEADSGLKKRTWVITAAAITMLVVTLSLHSYSLRRSTAPNRRAPDYLYLTVERAGPSLRLLWDRNSLAVRGATGAVLHIQDGNQQSDRQLTSSEFGAGSYMYEPKSSAVTFRLEAYATEPNAIGLVQVMLPPSSPTPVPPVVANSQPLPPNKLLSPPPPAKPFARPEQRSANLAEKRNVNDEVRLPAIKSSVPTETVSIKASHPSPTIGFHELQPQSLHPDDANVSTPEPQPSVRALTTPVKGSRLGRLIGKIPLVGRLRKPSKTVAPVPLHQTQPTFKLSHEQKLIEPVSVDVKVQVAESGAVTDAEVVDYGDPPNFPLAKSALAAARNWTFEPSRVDDIPVASQVVIHFYFSP